MQDASYQILVERLVQCQDLAEHARDPSVRAKATELAQGYRKLILSVDRLSPPSGVGSSRRPPSLWVS